MGHIGTPVPTMSVEGTPVIDHFGAPIPMGIRGSDHLSGHTSRSEPLRVRTLKLYTFDDTPDLGRFGIPNSKGPRSPMSVVTQTFHPVLQFLLMRVRSSKLEQT